MTELNIHELEKRKLIAEIKKIEAEKQKILSDKLKQEKHWFRQSSFWSSIVAVMIPVLTIIIGYYFGGGKKYFDAEHITLEYQKDKLRDQIVADSSYRNFILETNKKLVDSTESLRKILSQEIKSFITSNEALRHDKNQLTSIVQNLTFQQTELKSDLGFSILENNLQELKIYADPNYKFVDNLIKSIESNSTFSQRIVDSLNSYARFDNMTDISYFILFRGTNRVEYKRYIFQRIPNMIRHLNEPMYIGYFHILANSKWSNSDRMEICQIIMDNIDSIKSNYLKLAPLNVIRQFSNDSIFDLPKVDYNLYWDYLRENRNIALSQEAINVTNDALINIANFSPQLYYAVIFESINHDTLIGAISPKALITFSQTIDGIPASCVEVIKEFVLRNTELNKTNNALYIKNNNRMRDHWILGDFDFFRKNPNQYWLCVEKNSF